ncbi:MAG TPA: hypothetical protein VD948_08855 [Rhodothermales bacterium]|nr:hypothetical protein [Rhodothermales bacterium]
MGERYVSDEEYLRLYEREVRAEANWFALADLCGGRDLREGFFGDLKASGGGSGISWGLYLHRLKGLMGPDTTLKSLQSDGSWKEVTPEELEG